MTDAPTTFDRLDGFVEGHVPARFRRIARRVVWAPIDLMEKLTGRRTSILPPRGLRGVGAGDFVEVGQTFVSYLERWCGLGPESRVLDVGCGIGRMAIPLTRVLGERGRYDGIDVVKRDVSWCSRHISGRFGNFYFHHLDVRNHHYNPAETCPDPGSR